MYNITLISQAKTGSGEIKMAALAQRVTCMTSVN